MDSVTSKSRSLYLIFTYLLLVITNYGSKGCAKTKLQKSENITNCNIIQVHTTISVTVFSNLTRQFVVQKRIFCQECNVPRCAEPCFKIYHTKGNFEFFFQTFRVFFFWFYAICDYSFTIKFCYFLYTLYLLYRISIVITKVDFTLPILYHYFNCFYHYFSVFTPPPCKFYLSGLARKKIPD